MPQLSLHTPLGALSVSEEGGVLVAVEGGWGCDQTETALLCEARRQIHAFFDGTLTEFALPLRPGGTAYRQRVWAALRRIPHGQTRTYGQIAAEAGGSARSVGGACAANPLLLLIPCHRVVGAAGADAMVGFSGADGIESKRFLLELERANPLMALAS